MSMSEEERKVIVALEMEKAKSTMKEAETLLKNELWNGVANRLYYAVFHAVSALLIKDKHQVNTHRGLHAMFAIHYIKTGVLPNSYGRLYSLLQTMRQESDYNCMYDVAPEELKEKIEPAKLLLLDIENLLLQ